LLSILFGALLYTAGAEFNTTAANRTLHLAWSAYCNETSLQDWNCEWCSLPYAAKNVSLVQYLKDVNAGTQGFVGVDWEEERIIVAYRGSFNLANTIEDAEFWLTHAPFAPPGVECDHGFMQGYLSLRNATQTALSSARSLCAHCAVLFTGHSLGAAMATMGAAELGNLEPSTPVLLYTFGSPRVGNRAFVAWAMQGLNTSSPMLRMRRQLDIVPAIPPRSIGYLHLPTEIWNKHSEGVADSYIKCDASGEDPSCGDSEEHPAFPLDLLHLKPAEHTRYMGYGGGSCKGGPSD